MSKKLEEYIKESLKGVWSPLFRRKIAKEIRNHVEDIEVQEGISQSVAVTRLGKSLEMNLMYRKLFYKKLRNDFLVLSSLGIVLFTVGMFSIHKALEVYFKDEKNNYYSIRENYLQDLSRTYSFNRVERKNNAAHYIIKILEKDELRLSDIEGLLEFDYWSHVATVTEAKEYLSTQIIPDKHYRIVKFLKEKIKEKDSIKLRKLYKHLAKLYYSSETTIGLVISQNMMEDIKVDFKKIKIDRRVARRIYQANMNLLNLKPRVIHFEKDLKNLDYYEAGICHLADHFFTIYESGKNLLKSDFPYEIKSSELVAMEKIKTKMEEDCSLDFLRYSKKPKHVSFVYLYDYHFNQNDAWNKDSIHERFAHLAYYSLGNVPYLRNFFGRLTILSFGEAAMPYSEYYEKKTES